MKKWKFPLLMGLLMTGNVLAKDSFIVRFDLTDSIKEFLRKNDFDITGISFKTNEIEALVNSEELEKIKAQNANFKFSFPASLVGSPDEEYKTPNEIEDFIRDIHSRYPDLTEVKSIGKTLEGRDIWAIKISDNARVDEKEPVLFINGMHHAREVMTPEITTDMVEYLVTNYGKNSDVTRWVDNTEIWVIPMFNLDGNHIMWTEDSMWRKNARGGFGVDINRNYPASWNSCNGSSSSRYAQDYRGDSAGSEPETQAMMNFVGSIKPVFSISYHSYSEIVIYPLGCKNQRTPSASAIESIGAELAKKVNYKPGTSWELLYSVDGGDIDWYYKTHQVIPYVIEVNSMSEGFHPSYSKWRNKTVERNRKGWMYLLDRFEGPSIHGSLSNAEYSKVAIFKSGDKTAFQEYTINPDGTFYIIVKPGTYDLSFQGSKSQRMNGIVVNAKKVISL